MRFLLLCFMLYFKKYIRNNSNSLSSFSNTYYRTIYSGYDERYPVNQTDNDVQLNNIYRNNKNKNLLDILQNDKISINKKLDLLKDNSIKPTNLKAGGLMNDYNFTLD